MNVDPFWLNDRVVPSGANDPVEVEKLGKALSDLGEDITEHSEPAVTEAMRRFQQSRGLQVDGVAQVNGPTAQRIAGERHEAQVAARPPRQNRTLGEQHSVPIRDSVGDGGRNRPDDQESVMRALAINNFLSRYAALNPGDTTSGSIEPEAERALAAFRKKHGIRETGPVAPGSESLRVLNQITAPRLHHLVGDDISHPVTVSGKVDAPVVRRSPDSPTARAVPFRDEDRITHETAQDEEIARRQATHISREVDAVTRGEAAPPSARDHAMAALHTDPEMKDLTARQLNRMREIARESELDLASPATRARVATYMRDNEPDFLTPLQEKFEAGEVDAEKLEKLTENWARQVSTHGANPVSVARLEAGTTVLKQALLSEGQDATDAYEKIEALMNGAGQGEPEIPLIMEMFPGVGELVAATEAAGSFREARAAQARGDVKTANAAWTAFALAIAGTVPFAGKAVKVLRHLKVFRDAEKILDTQVARRKLLKAENDFGKPFEAKSAQEMIGADAWAGFDEKTRNAFETSFTHAKGRQGEVLLKELIDRARLDRPLGNTEYLRRYYVQIGPNSWRRRHFDEVAIGKMELAMGGLIIRKTDDTAAVAYEVKFGSSGLSKNQRIADKAIADGAESKSGLSKQALDDGLELPPEIDEIKHLRIPIWAIPKERLIGDVRQSLTTKGIPDDVIAQFEERLEIAYNLEKNFSAIGREDLASALTVAVVLGINLNTDEEAFQAP